MRTCRKIYHEAADSLHSHGKFGLYFGGGAVDMLGHVTNMEGEGTPCFGAFEHVRNLEVIINTREYEESVCQIYCHMAKIASQLKSSKQLQNVEITLGIRMATDLYNDINREYLKKRLLYHRDGSASRQHIAAFILDPLRDVRLVAGGRITFSCNYFDLSAFKDIPKVLTLDNATGRPVGNHACFSS